MKKNIHIIFSTTLIIVFLALGLTGCGPRTTPTPEPSPTSTPEPQATPTATAVPEKIVLFDPSAQAGEAVGSLVSEFAAANSIGFETWSSLSDLTGVKVMVVYGTLDNLADAAASAPQTQFLAVTQNAAVSANVSTLSANPVHLAFVAGYLTAMTSTEWRAGALLSDDANLGLADAFYNGGQYLCGRCTPKYGPMLSYPQVYTEVGSADAAAWTILAEALWTDTTANSVYVDPAADYPEVLNMFSEEYLFTSNAASANLAHYTAVLGPDTLGGIQSALPDLLAGSGGKVFSSPVTLTVINNTDLISPAKQARVNEIAEKLASDQINPLAVP